MLSTKDAIEAVRPLIEGILQQARQCTGPVVSLRDQALEILLQAGLVYTMTCASEHVLVHDQNRFGEGLVPWRIVELFIAILGLGFSFHETDPVAFEIPLRGPRRQVIEEFNMHLAEKSDGVLAPVQPNAAKLASVCGSHLTAGLRAVHFQMPWPEAAHALMLNGKLNGAKIGEVCKHFGKAINEGLQYRVIRAEVEEAFPDLPDLFQEVGNIAGHLHKGESYIAILLKIHSRATARGGPIDWDLVQRLVVRSQPPNPGDVESMCRYVALWSGSDRDAFLLRELHEYASSLNVVRTVRGPTFAALAALDFGKGKGGRLRIAVLKACTSAAEQFCNSAGECTKLIGAKDIATMAVKKQNHASAKQADGIMQTARKLVDDSEARKQVPGKSIDKLLNRLDVDLILCIFKKLAKDQAPKTLDGIGARFYTSLAQCMGCYAERLDANPWADALQGASNASIQTAQRTRTSMPTAFAQLGETGDLQDYTGMLRSAGIVPKVFIQKRDEAEQRLEVVEIAATEVTVMQCTEGKTKKMKVTLQAAAVLEEYELWTEPATQLSEADLSTRIPSLNKDIVLEMLTSSIKVGLLQLDMEFKKYLKFLKATVEPATQRAVFAAKNIPKGTPLLAPISMNIQKVIAGRTYNDTSVDLGVVKSATGGFSWRFVILSPKVTYEAALGTSNLPLFWFVKDVKHHELANITLTKQVHEINGITIKVPVMQAKKYIEEGTQLTIAREKIET